MNDINSIKIISWALKLALAAYAIYSIVKFYKNSGKEKAKLKKLIIQQIKYSTAGFILFFAAAWLWFYFKHGNAAVDPVSCIIYGLLGFFIGMLLSFLNNNNEDQRIKKNRKATEHQAQGDAE